MKTILVTAYAVNPYKGSEDGMGWNFINQIAKSYRVIAITRENNLPAIQKFLNDSPEVHHGRIQFLGYDLPPQLRFWKRGSFGSLPYFYLWQRSLPAFIRRQGLKFDLAHNLNFHNDWTPSFLWKLNKPFVWGPIGHHPRIPAAFLRPFGKKALFMDRFRWAVKQLFWRGSRALRTCARQADLVLAMNGSVKEVLPLVPQNMFLMPSVGTPWVPAGEEETKEVFEMISVGRFVPLKGFDLSIKAFASFFHSLSAAQQGRVRLRLVGKGPLLAQMKAMVKELDIEQAVVFVEWVEKEKLDAMYRDASAFLFPSHEGAGMVVAEAMSYGLPVICLDNCGPGEFVTEGAGIRVPYEDYDETISHLSDAMRRLFGDQAIHQRLSSGARARFEDFFDWDAKGESLRSMYNELLTTA
jgi:glycosyltransferase involved in cell wall biosynthesis